MVAIAERSVTLEKEVVYFNNKDISRIERVDNTTIIVRPRGRIVLEYANDSVHRASYDINGNMVYEDFIKYDASSPKVALATEETNLLERMEYWNDFAHKNGNVAAQRGLKEAFQRKINEQKKRLELAQIANSIDVYSMQNVN